MAPTELGTFLRQRREAVSPEEVGLPRGGRRRTPGLRRAELATLAGVSVDYLTRLEQGRDRNPSAQVLAALADTLRLTDEERMLLMQLGTIASSREMCPSLRPPDREVRPSVRLMVGRMEPTVAAVVDRAGDVLVATDAFDRVWGGLGLLDHEPPNLVRLVFGDPRAQSRFPAWEAVADAVAAELAVDLRSEDPELQKLLDDVGPEGADALLTRQRSGPTVARRAWVLRVVHPEVGELRLAHETMVVADTDQRLVVDLPQDEATARALDHLVLGGSGGLRAVPG